MLTAVLVALVALGLSAFAYLGLERSDRRSWVPLLCRAIGWTALGLLLVNLSCPGRNAPPRPLVLLDASLSLSAAGGHWQEARDSALSWGDVRTFGDERVRSDTVPDRGRSLLVPALLAASASDRPVIVVSDGEIEDARDIPPDILSRSGVRLFRRDTTRDLAVTRVTGPRRVSEGDSIALDVLVQSTTEESRDSIGVQVLTGNTRLASRRVRLRGENAGRVRIWVPSSRLGPGDHVLRVSLLQAGDPEPRTDSRLHIVTVAPTPGVVLLASPGDWDSRFLYRAMREVSQLPVRGFVRMDGNRWRSMSDLRPVQPEQVRRAARQADLLILKGAVGAIANQSRARGIWTWPSGESGPTQSGDWYLVPREDSPVAGAFLGQPVDSFPPAIQLTLLDPPPGAWIGLVAQLGRRGPQRPAIYGVQSDGVRRVTVAVDGLWRWAFRSGSSEQSYRSWVAATASWLLGGVDSTQGLARPLQPVVANGRPIVFQWMGSGPAVPLPVIWSGSAGQQSDTLYFDGEGRATVWRETGEHRYRMRGGGQGKVAVEQYSDELLPRPITLSAQNPGTTRAAARTSARDWLWLFGICILAFSSEWFARRRFGLR